MLLGWRVGMPGVSLQMANHPPQQNPDRGPNRAGEQLGAPILGHHHPWFVPKGHPLPGSMGCLWPLVGVGWGGEVPQA